jgi:competence protein ComEC
MLTALRTAVVRTDRSGTAVLTAEGDGGFQLWSERTERTADAHGGAGGDVGGGP